MLLGAARTFADQPSKTPSSILVALMVEEYGLLGSAVLFSAKVATAATSALPAGKCEGCLYP